MSSSHRSLLWRARHSLILCCGLALGMGTGAGLYAPVLQAAEAAPGSTTASAPDVDFTPIYDRIQGWIDHGYYSGASLVVVQGDRTLCLRFFGDHNESSVEYIASAGKWLAAATIMAVVDSGKLSLDDPASRRLPELHGVMAKATLRQMLSHTSGYPTYEPSDKHIDNYQTLAESVTNLALLPPAFPPGSRWDYGGLALQAAGRMAELASGMDWETLFQTTIAKPLGMVDTHFTPVDPGFGHSPMLGGGARSSLRDYRRFLAMIAGQGMFEGKRILSAAAVAEMQANQVGDAAVDPGNYATQVRHAAHHGIYGLGEWRELVTPEDRCLVVSSPSWAGTYPWVDHRYNLYGFFLGHEKVDIAGKDHFNGMFASSELATMVAQAVAAAGAGAGK